MKFLKQLVLAAVCAAGLLSLCAVPVSAQTVEKIKENNRLIAGVMVDFPPYGFTNEQGEPQGFDIDVATELAKRMGVPVELVAVSGPNRIPYLLSGRVDLLVAALGITPERAKQVDFSTPYERLNLWLYARKDLEIKDYPDLAGHTFAVTRGNTADLALSAHAPEGTNILRFDDDAADRQAIRTQQVDGGSGSDFSIAQTEKELPGVYERKFPLISQVQGVAIRKGEDDLVTWTNQQIGDMIKDGTLEAIRRKWIGQGLLDLTPPQL